MKNIKETHISYTFFLIELPTNSYFPQKLNTDMSDFFSNDR